MLHESLHRLREEFRSYVAGYAPHIRAFCGDALFQEHPMKPIAPSQLPMCGELHQMKTLAESSTQPLTEAVLAASEHVCWRQSYTIDDDGIDQDHLDHYGWFNLIAPSGPFVSDTVRLSIGYWGKGLTYPVHWHEPEEIYLTLSGVPIYHSQGRASVKGGPGTSVCHYSNQPHGADFSASPALVAAFWCGDNLEKKSVIGDG